MKRAHDWRHELQRRDTLQTDDDIAATVANLPYDRREELRQWLAEKQRTDGLTREEAGEMAKFRDELAGAAPWIRAGDRTIALRVIRAFMDRR